MVQEIDVAGSQRIGNHATDFSGVILEYSAPG